MSNFDPSSNPPSTIPPPILAPREATCASSSLYLEDAPPTITDPAATDNVNHLRRPPRRLNNPPPHHPPTHPLASKNHPLPSPPPQTHAKSQRCRRRTSINRARQRRSHGRNALYAPPRHDRRAQIGMDGEVRKEDVGGGEWGWD